MKKQKLVPWLIDIDTSPGILLFLLFVILSLLLLLRDFFH